MADVKFNFNSQWPTIQVTRVINSPETTGQTTTNPRYTRVHAHGLGYPPLAIGMWSADTGETSSGEVMANLDVDSMYVYIRQPESGYGTMECAVIYAVDISTPFNYSDYDSATSDPLVDTSGGTLDLRNFLLHSRAVGPMLLNVHVEDFGAINTGIAYSSKLSYPSFSFGSVYGGSSAGDWRDIWIGAPLAGQSAPTTKTDGYMSTIISMGTDYTVRGSIIVLRNPAIITNNSVDITV